MGQAGEGTLLKRLALYFEGPQKAALHQEEMPAITPDQVLVQTLFSAISPGTEMLVYRGQFPQDLAIDETISAMRDGFSYPLKYGYSLVGRVIEIGEQVEAGWLGKLVFCFHPHESCFFASPGELLQVPEGIAPEEAVFLSNMETAVNFIMDGRPAIGEQVAVFGQGIVGLLTTGLLARFPLGRLVTLDKFPLRRQASLDCGADASLDPSDQSIIEQARSFFEGGADLAYELSGSPQALDQAIASTGFDGRVIIGSFYGQKRANLDLGGYFHRSRIRLISSQVSSLSPEWSGRWTKERRFELAWNMIGLLKPGRFITQRFHITQAEQAFRLIDQSPQATIQVIFTY